MLTRLVAILLAIYLSMTVVDSKQPSTIDKRVSEIKQKVNAYQAEEAHGMAQQLVKQYPKNSDAHAILGRTLLMLRRLNEAEKAERQAIKLDPNSAMAHFYLGMVLTELLRADEAVKEYQTAVKLKPKIVKEGGCGDCSWVKKLTQ